MKIAQKLSRICVDTTAKIIRRCFKNPCFEAGVALPLVIVIIALSSTIVVGVTYSTYMSGRLNASLEQGLRGEYLVKSALNLARVLVWADSTAEDSQKDGWAIFKNGSPVPLSLLGIDEPNIKVDLEISPLGAKIPLRCLVTTSEDPPPLLWLNAFKKLFEDLGFDDDQEADQSGRFDNRVFKPSEVVANIVDYLDRDSESLEVSGFQGIESDLPNGYFKNRPMKRETELSTVPGITAARLQSILKYVSTASSCKININSASAEVLGSLHPDITPAQVEAIINFRNSEDGPFKQVPDLQKGQYLSDAVYKEIFSNLEANSSRFIVIAKADFLANVTFLRASIDTQRDKTSLPKITTMELY